MKKFPVITNVPVRLPISQTILYTFLLHYFNADGIYWGIFITLAVIVWIIKLIAFCTQEAVNLNQDKDTPAKSKFVKRLEELARSRKTV